MAYGEAYAEGRKHWRAELATPKAFAAFLETDIAPRPPARVLEAGCGDGLNAIFLAMRGYRVTGADVSEKAIARAREAAHEAGAAIEFLCLDLAAPGPALSEPFDLWVDIKTLHALWDDDKRQAYLRNASMNLRSKGVLYLTGGLAMSDVRDYFPDVFAQLDPATRAWAEARDRDLPPDKRRGIRCETLDGYCMELEAAGFEILHAQRFASLAEGWGAEVTARTMDRYTGSEICGLEADLQILQGISGAGVYVSELAVGCAEENSIGLEHGPRQQSYATQAALSGSAERWNYNAGFLESA